MSKIKSETLVERNEDKWECNFSFIIESEDGLQSSKINAKATGECLLKICSDVLPNDDEKLHICWRGKVKTLWLSLDEKFVFSKNNHDHEDYSSGISDFERLAQKNNYENYSL